MERTPTRLEREADPADLALIREQFGSRAQTLINILLSWDGFLNWYFPLKDSVPFMCPLPLREERALSNMQLAVDMFEIYERVTIRNSKSFMPHAAVFKMTQDILIVGDIWAVDLSPLELLNAVLKRVAEESGSRHIEYCNVEEQRKPLRSGAEGPARLVSTSRMSNTMAVSTMNHILMQNTLRRGDGEFRVPDSRRTERLLQTGRTKHLSAGLKQEKVGVEEIYNPRKDSCVKAFARLLRSEAAAATEAAAEAPVAVESN